MGKLQGKIALVTGAGSGIGQAIAARFTQDGATVIAVDRNTIAPAPGQTAIACDITNPAEVSALFERVRKDYGRLDVLANNAGISCKPARLHELPLEDFDRVLAVNLRGAFVVLKYALPLMLDAKGGAVINTASTASFVAFPVSSVAYTSSKGGILQLTKQAALEYAPDNIRVNCICPGLTLTNLVAGNPQAVDALSPLIPLGRPARSEEIAAVAAFLASDDASYVTGAAYLIDGGATII